MVSALTNNNRIAVFFLWLGVNSLLTPSAHALATTSTLHHTSTDFQEAVNYTLQWSGIPLGKAYMTWEETANTYKGRITIQTSGVASIFNIQKRTLETNGRIERHEDTATYYPEFYRNLVKYKKKQRDMKIWFDAQGVESKYEVTPPDNRATRPEVSDIQRDKAFDILTAIMFARTNIAKGEQNIQFQVFDSRRLTGIQLKKLPNTKVTSYLGSHTPDAGYTMKELKEYEDEEPDVTLEFKNNASIFPSRAFAKPMLGTIEAIVIPLKN